jgi:hypothetical protein
MRTRMTQIGAIAVTCAAFVSIQESRVYAQPAETGFKGIVRIRVVADPANGFAPPLQTVWYDFLPGESKSFMASAGHNGELCRTGAAGPMPFSSPEFQAWAAKEEASAQYVWHFDVRMIEVKANSVAFELSWQRSSRASVDERLQFSQRLTMRQGDTRPIDLIHGASGGSCLSVTIFADADIADDPPLVGKVIEWDLWASAGPKTTAHQAAKSVQGETAEFRFDPLTVPGDENDEQILFFGAVTGRARLDGDIDVAIDVGQLTIKRLEKPGEVLARFKKRVGPGPTWTFRKTLTAKPGEAVKIVVPTGLQRRTTDPATGKNRIEFVPPVYEMSITVQARMR